MLTSPTCDANGYSNTFGQSDFASLKTSGSNRNLATEANLWMVDAEQFLSAYGGRIDKALALKLQSSLEVRMVMFVHQKKCDTRASFSSLLDIAQDLYTEAKKYDGLLPRWAKLPGSACAKTSSAGKAGLKIGSLRETGGLINESILAEKGFLINKQIVDVGTGDKYTISSFNSDEKTILCTLFEAASPQNKKKPAKTITLDRAELLLGEKWHPSTDVATSYLENIKDPLDSFDLKASIISGACKNATALEFAKSNESDCTVSVTPDVKVYASKAFRSGNFKLVGLTNNITVQPDDKQMLVSARPIGTGKGWRAYARSSNSSVVQSAAVSFLAKFYTVHTTFDQGAVNCAYQDKEVEINVMGEKEKVLIPMIVNTAPIAVGDEIVVLKVSHEQPVEPPSKKHKAAPKTVPKAAPKNKAAPKATPKGRK